MWSTRSSAVSGSPAHEGDTARGTTGGRGPTPATGLDRRGRQRPIHRRGRGRGAEAEPPVGDGTTARATNSQDQGLVHPRISSLNVLGLSSSRTWEGQDVDPRSTNFCAAPLVLLQATFALSMSGRLR